MRIDFAYNTYCQVTFTLTSCEVWVYDHIFSKTKDALNFIEAVFEDEYAINASLISSAIITSTETGEIIAECFPDDRRKCTVILD